MCGVNGLFAFNAAAGAPARSELLATRDAMASRGPDGSGAWWSADGRLGLGHRRLSIIDPTDRAGQPMLSGCRRYTITFNGEIYNFRDLRRTLEAQGRVFMTTSDTEVLLHLYAVKGAEMVRDLRGMFAFAIWDDDARTLFLARDPYGIKPLYTCSDGWTFRFASQVKALLAGGRVSRDPEPAGLVGFHLWGAAPEPFTLYRDIRALPAGHTQLIDAAGPRQPTPYASIAETFAAGARAPADGADVEARVRAATRDSVCAHLVSDVEVGLFLSAGVDSGALLGLMRDLGQTKIRAVTLGFEEFQGTREDETPLAAELARRYGADHVVRIVTEAEFRADLPAILDAMDQPTIDGVNTWFVAKAAREAGLKVALSGLGGDELLAGYPSFEDIPRWVSRLRLAASVPGAGEMARLGLSAAGLTARNPKAAGLLKYGGSYPGAYLLRRGLFLPFELRAMLDRDVVETGLRRLQPLDRIRRSMTPYAAHPTSRVAALESANYLRNQLLRDADWAGMAHGIEIRTPFVDFTLAGALAPVAPRLGPGMGKRALAAAPSTPLPSSIVDRPKTGFSVPTGRWLAASAGSQAAASKGEASRAWARRVIDHQTRRGAADAAQPVFGA